MLNTFASRRIGGRGLRTAHHLATDAQSPLRTTRPPPSRSLRVGPLPTGYDLSAVIKATIRSAQRIEPGATQVDFHAWSPQHVVSLLKANDRNITLNDEKYPIQPIAPQRLSALSVARLGYQGLARSIYISRSSPEDFDLAALKDTFSQFGPVEKISEPFATKDPYTVSVDFLNSEAAEAAYKNLTSDSPVVPVSNVYPSLSTAQVDQQNSDVLCSNLPESLSARKLLEYAARATNGFFGERVFAVRVVNDEAGRTVKILFVLPRQAEYFAKFIAEKQKTEPGLAGVNIQIAPASKPSDSMSLAIKAGASRTLTIDLPTGPVHHAKVLQDFAQYKAHISSNQQFPTAYLTLPSVYSATRLLTDLATGNHTLSKYEGLKVNFARVPRIRVLEPVTIAQAKAIEAEPTTVA